MSKNYLNTEKLPDVPTNSEEQREAWKIHPVKIMVGYVEEDGPHKGTFYGRDLGYMENNSTLLIGVRDLMGFLQNFLDSKPRDANIQDIQDLDINITVGLKDLYGVADDQSSE